VKIEGNREGRKGRIERRETGKLRRKKEENCDRKSDGGSENILLT